MARADTGRIAQKRNSSRVRRPTRLRKTFASTFSAWPSSVMWRRSELRAEADVTSVVGPYDVVAARSRRERGLALPVLPHAVEVVGGVQRNEEPVLAPLPVRARPRRRE